MIKVLNLYAGIGGNRKLWENVGVTAVENNPEIAKIYQDFFPNDKVVVGDAHAYLLEHFKEFDFIWSSPPCPSHSITNHFLHAQGVIRFPDMKLYEEIIFLKYWFKGKWIIENVRSYYEPLIKPQESGRHYFWSNFLISNLKAESDIGTMNRNASTLSQRKATIGRGEIPELSQLHRVNLKKYNLKNKRQILRNCVNSQLALHVFNMAFKEPQTTLLNNQPPNNETK